MQPDKNYEVQNEDVEISMKEIGDVIGKSLPKGWGFNLMVFDFGKKGSMFYMSNAQRKDVINQMKEFMQKYSKH